MKKRISLILSLIILVTGAVYVSASSRSLSSALNVIASDTVMIRSAAIGENVVFSTEDFKLCLGNVPTQIKIKSLPDVADGKLCLGSTEVFSGQTISAANYPLLNFVPNINVTKSSFEFTLENEYIIRCDLRLYDSNSSPLTPESGMVSAVTHSDITAYGKLAGYDTDGDELFFEVSEYPSKGIVNITDINSGSYTYTPYDGITGVDSFSYRVKDSYGNYSEECTVNFTITDRAGEILLADMDGHWAHNAALAAVSDGSMDIIYEMDKAYFDPDETLTREEFLKAVMVSLGCPDLPDTVTVFADDSDISDGYGGYVSAAYKLNIIEGTVGNDGLRFEPHAEITRAEGAVILNRILGAETDEAIPALSDMDLIPAWAEGDMRALISAGIISGNGNSLCPLAHLTRAETAQMIYSAKNLYS